MSNDKIKPEPRNIKLQLMVSQSELDAIDAWQFRHRIPSRAAAIRKIVRKAVDTLRDDDAAIAAVDETQMRQPSKTKD